jgi:hypothetical protein
MKLARAIFAVLIATAFATMFTFSASAQDRNCPSFATQEEAQQYFQDGGGSADNNFNGLDRDRDGIACEDLPSGGGNSGGDVPVDNSGDVPADTTDNGDTSGDVPADTTDTTDTGDTSDSGEVATGLPTTGSGPTSGTDAPQIAVLALLSLVTLGAASQVNRRRA